MSDHSNKHNLFVYGTLRKDSSHEMYRTLAENSTFLGEGTIKAKLYELGSYPGIVLTTKSNDIVRGEVYSLNPGRSDEIWSLLDEYEGCSINDPEPHEYQRQPVHVTLSDGAEVEAWAYVLRQVPEKAKPIHGGDYLAWQRRLVDSRSS